MLYDELSRMRNVRQFVEELRQNPAIAGAAWGKMKLTSSTYAEVNTGVIVGNATFPTPINDTEAAVVVKVNRAGVVTDDQVTVDAADSAGIGFRALRVPN